MHKLFYVIQTTLYCYKVFSIKQVWNLKNSIEKWDQKHLEDSGILNLLLTCISNSKFLACAEGRKCLALLFLFGSPVVQVNKNCDPYISVKTDILFSIDGPTNNKAAYTHSIYRGL